MSLEQAVGSSGQWLHALLLHAAAAGSHRLDPSARDPAGVATALPPLEAWE
jgi:hypothetical protein